jgi:LDH2 family malate/lactate/ureidoglycolate dehydrogenase
MKVKIQEATKLSQQILQKWGFTGEEAELSTENFIEGELTGKKSHGLVRLPWIKKKIEAGSINLEEEEIEIAKETPVSLLIDGKRKTGFYVVNKLLEMGFEKVGNSGMCILGTTNTAEASGLIGLYARKAAEKDLIFLAFNNSPGGLVPHGSIQQMWGTNPITVGIPSNELPVILDMASTQITWGHLLVAKAQGKEIPEGVAIDENGDVTTDPSDAMKGGLLPFFGHKGSGLGFVVELLGGALTASRVGNNVDGGWGSLMILIDPNILRDLADFKNDVSTASAELKNSPKMKGFEEIYYPGERSQKNRQQALDSGIVEVDDSLYSTLREYLK